MSILARSDHAIAFRHDPDRFTIRREEPEFTFNWRVEPALTGYRRFIYDRKAGNLPVPVCATPAVISGVGAIVGTYDGTVTFLNQDLSKSFWRRNVGGAVYAAVVVDQLEEKVFVTAINGNAVCYDLRGEVIWSLNVGGPVYAAPLVLKKARQVLFCCFGSRAVWVGIDTGQKTAEVDLPKPWHWSYRGKASYRDPYATPVSPDGELAIVCCAEHVVLFDPDGRTNWQISLPGSIKSSPVLTSTTEAIASMVTGECAFISLPTGTITECLNVGSKIIASSAMSNSIVAVGDARGHLHGIDADQKTVIWTSDVGAPRDYSSVSVLPDGNFMSTVDRGNIVAVDSTNGRFLWESSQLTGSAEHGPEMDTTPVMGDDGIVYCGSYTGAFYSFSFRRQ